MKDRTQEALLRQVEAMDTCHFEVGLFKPGAQMEMILRTWDQQTLMGRERWIEAAASWTLKSVTARLYILYLKGKRPV